MTLLSIRKTELIKLTKLSLLTNYIFILACCVITVQAVTESFINEAHANTSQHTVHNTVHAYPPADGAGGEEAGDNPEDTEIDERELQHIGGETHQTGEQVEAEIRQIAEEHGFEWTEYLIRLAKCESSLNPQATNDKNNIPEDSVDRGLFQINDYHHAEVSDEVAYDLRLSTEWTMWRIESGFQHEWVCDRYI